MNDEALTNKLRKDLGLLEWQIRDLLPLISEDRERVERRARLNELETLEAQSDCLEDACGLDAELLRANLLKRISELRAALTNKPKDGKAGGTA